MQLVSLAATNLNMSVQKPCFFRHLFVPFCTLVLQFSVRPPLHVPTPGRPSVSGRQVLLARGEVLGQETHGWRGTALLKGALATSCKNALLQGRHARGAGLRTGAALIAGCRTEVRV